MNNHYEAIQKEKQVRRMDKITEARTAFLSDGGRFDKKGDSTSVEEGRRSFCLLRLVVAGTLFLVLMTAFHFQISYKGFDKSYVKEKLEDERHWQNLVTQVEDVMKKMK